MGHHAALARPHVRRFALFCVALIVALSWSSQRPRADDPRFTPPLSAQGAQPHHGTFSLLPWESIDMVSGNGVLTFTDLVLPGNAGFDLRFQRVLNLNSWTWRMGVPGPASVVLQLTGADPTDVINPNPIIVSMDGSQQYTFQTATNSAVYMTHSYWRFNKATKVLELPDGTVYTFGREAGGQSGT